MIQDVINTRETVKIFLVITSLMIAFLLLSFREPPKVKVDDILEDPGFYDGQKVEVTGIVMEVDVSETGKICFLRGSTGGSLRVILKKKPVIVYCEYSFKGTVHVDVDSGKAYLTMFSCRKRTKRENIHINNSRSKNLEFVVCAE